jgi:hypothetical protein
VNPRMKIYISAIVGLAIVLISWSLPELRVTNGPMLTGFVLVALLASTLKVRIPGLDGHYSLNFLVLLASLWELSAGEIFLMAAACGVTQSYWRAARRPQLVQVAFNASNVVVSMAVARMLFLLLAGLPEPWLILAGGLAAAGHYTVNGLLTSVVLCLVQDQPLQQIWRHWNGYVLPYTLLGSVLAAVWMLIRGRNDVVGLVTGVVVLYLLFRIVQKSLTPPDSARTTSEAIQR